MAKQTFTTGQVLLASQMTSLQQTAMGGGSTTAKTASYTLVAADAGTVVQMNSSSATTITVNQSLFAAGDTVQIQNVGAGVCTVTAGTATVSTSATLALKQFDAGSLYFNTTSAAIFFASDSADQIGGMTLLSTTTLSGATTTISSISAAHNNLQVFIFGVNLSTAASVNFNINGGSTGLYLVGQRFGSSTPVASSTVSNGTAQLNQGNTITTNTTNAWLIDLSNYASTTARKNFNLTGGFDSGSDIIVYTAGGMFSSTTAISSLTITTSTGTFSGGTVLVYGVS